MDSAIFEAFSKLGISAGVICVLCVISYAIIKHILKQSNDIMKMAMDMNIKWQQVIDEHTSQAREFHNNSNKAFDYVREEHKKMLENQLEFRNIQNVIQENLTRQFNEVCDKIKDSHDKGRA